MGGFFIYKFVPLVSDKFNMDKKLRSFIPHYLDFLRPNRTDEEEARLLMIKHLEEYGIDYNEHVIKDYIKTFGTDLDIFYKITEKNSSLPFTYSFRKYQMSLKQVG